MDTDLKKGVISMRKGTLAVFLDINNETSQARVIGRDIKNNWQVYIVFYNGNKKEYVSVGQAEKKNINFNLSKVQPKGFSVCGAAVGNKNTGEVYEGFFEDIVFEKPEIKKEEPKKENVEKSEPREIKEEPKKENEKELPKEKTDISEEKAREEKPENKTDIKATEDISTANNLYAPSPEQEAVYDEYVRNKKENKAEDTFKQVLKKFRDEMTELEKAGVFEKSETAEILSDRKNTAEKIDEIKNEIKEKYKNIIDFEQEENKNQVLKPIENKNIEYIFSNNEKLMPFKESNYDWVRICTDELWLIPLKKEEILNPFVMLADLKYKHLMLGREREGEKLVLAMPEKFSKDDLNTAYSYGFKDFWQSREENGDVFGYWIKDISQRS